MINTIKIYKCRIKKLYPFIIVGFFTSDYKDITDRLIASLENSDYDYAIFEIPSIHNSISPKGQSNSIYTKPIFIDYCIKLFNSSVLYLDTDTIVCDKLDLIIDLSNNAYDFACLNWLAVDDNSAYVNYTLNNETYLKFSHSIDYHCNHLLIVSGAVQFWGLSSNSFMLLNNWQLIIQNNPGVPDDHCLDYAFNNFIYFEKDIKYFWLPKSYARYAWWIFDRPIINHPQIPYSGGWLNKINDDESYKSYFISQLSFHKPKKLLELNEILNIKDMKVYSEIDNQILFVRDFHNAIWI